jgi:tetratricopeptide (TPR) repeat protein
MSASVTPALGPGPRDEAIYMPATAPRVVELIHLTDDTLADLDQPVASDRGRPGPPSLYGRPIGQARIAHRNGEFDKSEAAVSEALKIAARELARSKSAAAIRVARLHKAWASVVLAEHRLEQFDIDGAAKLFGEACHDVAEHSPSELPSELPAVARKAGADLLNCARHLSHAGAAQLAAAMFRLASSHLPEDVDPKIQLGLCLGLLGELTASASPLNEAVALYNEVLKSTPPPAVRCRAQINLADAIRQLGALEPDDTRKADFLDRAALLLHETIGSIPEGDAVLRRVDYPRALDGMGLVLLAQGRLEDAIATLEHARGEWRDDNERARTLNNLAEALRQSGIRDVEQSQLEKAKEAFGRALQACDAARAVLSERASPLAWGYAEHVRGITLLQFAYALHKSEPDKARLLCREAGAALRAARDHRPEEWVPVLWATSSVHLGDAILEAGRLEGTNAGLEQAADLYTAALRRLPRRHWQPVLYRLRAVSEVPEESMKINEGFYLSINDNIVGGMTKNAEISAVIFNVLSSLGLPRSEWPAFLRGAADGLAAPIPALPDEVVKRRTSAPLGEPGTKSAQKLPEPPSGLKWPVETYSGSPEGKRGGGIIAYLDRVWLPLLRAAPDGIGLHVLRAVDPSAAKGIDNLTQRRDPSTGEHLKLPRHLQFPTKKEALDRKLRREGLSAVASSPRLIQTLASRLRRGVTIPSPKR